MDNNNNNNNTYHYNNSTSLWFCCLSKQLIELMQFNPFPIHTNIKSIITQTNQQFEIEKTISPNAQQQVKSNYSSNSVCTLCHTQFDSIELQREHFKSDWHRFNLKLTIDHPGKHTVTQNDFLNKLEQLQDSLSGSEDSSSDSSSDQTSDLDHVSKLENQFKSFHLDSQFDDDEPQGFSSIQSNALLHHTLSTNPSIIPESTLPEDHALNSIKLLSSMSPLAWFNVPGSTSLTHGIPHQSPNSYPIEAENITQLGFYRCIFPNTFVQDRLLKNHPRDQLGEQYKFELSQLQHDFLPNNFIFKDDLNFSNEEAETLLDTQDEKKLENLPPIWTLLMVGGGHFAAMVVSVVPKLRHVGKNKPPEIEPVILLHKTFHRYTTRRKQGGGQASHDAGGKGAAKSAGANLRRYNEQALAEDIQDLLNSWSDKIQRSDLIFIRSTKSNLKLLFNDRHTKGQDNERNDQFKLNRGDDRIRNFPFVTRRPTFNELKRCFNELTRVKIIKTTKQELSEKELELKTYFEKEKIKYELQVKTKLEQEEKIRSEEEKKRKEKMPKEKTQEEKEKELEISRWERIIDLVKKGKLEQLQEFIKKYDQIAWLEMIPSTIIEEADLTHGCVNLLQIASMSDQAEVVEWMLSDGKSDPTMKGSKVGTKGNLPAYELANSKNTRNAFRRVMAREPERWNWIKEARVPSGLTEELETNQALKSKEWKNKMKDKIKERDRIRLQNEEKERIQAANDAQKGKLEDQNLVNSKNQRQSAVNRLGSATRTNNIHSHLPGLSEAQQARLERERRARAAEARLQK